MRSLWTFILSWHAFINLRICVIRGHGYAWMRLGEFRFIFSSLLKLDISIVGVYFTGLIGVFSYNLFYSWLGDYSMEGFIWSFVLFNSIKSTCVAILLKFLILVLTLFTIFKKLIIIWIIIWINKMLYKFCLIRRFSFGLIWWFKHFCLFNLVN